MDKWIESVIMNYIHERLLEPKKLWPEYYFRQQSYSRWAATEVLEYIRNHPEKSPIAAVEEFIHKMDDFSCAGHTDQNDSFIFSVAHDIATDILDVLICYIK